MQNRATYTTLAMLLFLVTLNTSTLAAGTADDDYYRINPGLRESAQLSLRRVILFRLSHSLLAC